MRHWHGELALPLAYWGNTVLMTLGLMAGLSVAPMNDLGIKSPIAFSASLVGLWLIMTAMSIWQFVGVWRAAANYIDQGKSRLWGNLAKIVAILGLLAASMEFVSVGIPQMEEYIAMAAGKDALGTYHLRLSGDGTQLEIAGAIISGLTNEVHQTLDVNRSVRTIHLNSIGGRVNEARKLRDLIASRGLTTYTASGCLSACTLAFIGGQKRLVARNATLGFHQYSFPGATDSAFRVEYEKDRQDWLKRGIARNFVDKVFAAPGSEMWKPTHQELFEAGVLTDYPERYDKDAPAPG